MTSCNKTLPLARYARCGCLAAWRGEKMRTQFLPAFLAE